MIPYLKYKDIHLKAEEEPTMSLSCRGEYRAFVTNENGQISSDTGWKSNTLLDRYFDIIYTVNPFVRMYVGDSDAAVVTTQTGLQGTVVGVYSTMQSGGYFVNGGAPDYERVSVEKCVWAPGQATGTVKEFVIVQSGSSAYNTEAVVRVVLAAPIAVGAADQLTIEHRFTWYPQVVDGTGVIDISGVAYNYTTRHNKIGYTPNAHPEAWYYQTGGYGYLKTGEIVAATGNLPDGNQCGYPSATSAVITGGVYPNQYSERIYTVGVDAGNDWGGLIRSWYTLINGPSSADQIGIQMRWGKVSDDTVLTKLNTHVLTFTARLLVTRHTP